MFHFPIVRHMLVLGAFTLGVLLSPGIAKSETGENEAAERAGFCEAALLKAAQNNEMRDVQKYSPVTRKYKDEIISKCGSLTTLNEVCFNKLSLPTRIFWNATGRGLKELSSPAPTTFLRNNPPGNLPMTRGMFMLAFCN